MANNLKEANDFLDLQNAQVIAKESCIISFDDFTYLPAELVLIVHFFLEVSGFFLIFLI
jgi:hypothetical protein